jgi:hypothetical protein
MKTNKIQTTVKSIAVAVVLLSSVNGLNAQSASDDVVMPLGIEKNATYFTEMEKLAQTRVKENIEEIKDWLNFEVTKEVDKADLETSKMNTLVNIEIGKDGKITSYELNDSSCEVCQILDKVMKNAPEFQPVAMNGYAVRMRYAIPVTVLVR